MHKPKLSGIDVPKRGEELKEYRKAAFMLWEGHPSISANELRASLKRTFGIDIAYGTVKSWLDRWSKKKAKSVVLPPQEVAKPAPSTKITWEQVVQAIPDRLELASLVLDGLLRKIIGQADTIGNLEKQHSEDGEKIKTLSEQLETITEDRKNVMAQLNSYIVKEKSRGGHFSLDNLKTLVK